MYEVKKAETQEEKNIVTDAMGEVGNSNAEHIWGVWDKEVCIGGTNVYNVNEYMPTDNFSISLKIKPCYGHWIIGYLTVTEALKVVNRLVAKVEVINLPSRKGARQLGFKPLYSENGFEYLELNKVSNTLLKQWNKHVQSNP